MPDSEKSSGRAPRVDLHVHTTASDGVYAPGEVVRLAKEAGLAAVAVTDHDTLGGVPEAVKAGRELGMEVVPGVELTSYVGEKEVHIIGLFVALSGGDGNDEAAGRVELFRRLRRERMLRMIGKLRDIGVEVDTDEVMAESGGGSVGRPHLATVLARHGHVADFGEAFEKYIGYGEPAYVPKAAMTPEEAIRLVRELGGLPVYAHPAVSRVDERLASFREAGLEAMEVWHYKHGAADVRHYSRLAEKHGLLPSGGSDFHGPGVSPTPLGVFDIGRPVLEALRERHAAMGKG